MGTNVLIFIAAVIFLIFIGIIAMLTWYKKIPQGKALVRTGMGGTKVVFDKGMTVVPVIHMVEQMDLSIKTIELVRMKEAGLICKDNIRADIKVVFFVRVNKDIEQIKKVAQSIGCQRASDITTLRQLFEAKFSEALKTVGKRLEFVELYEKRDDFRREIVEEIGDLNGYILDDAAIDYLEQTPLQYLSIDNILDSEGIKKITELTARQKVKANFIRREEEKTIKEQNVEAQEAILEYDRQLTEKEERQKREIANIKAREEAEIVKINEEERLRSETVRIHTEEELAIAEENKSRQIIVAAKNKERTEVVETERVDKDRLLEQTEKERIVTLAEIEKQKAVEEEKKNIQDVIRDRIMVEKKVVEEEEKIKDTRDLATANRAKHVAIIQAEEKGEAIVIEKQKLAEAEKLAAEVRAETIVIDAEAEKNASEKEAEARKIKAEAKAAEEATLGLSEAQVIEAKAKAKEQEGILEAVVVEKKAVAEAKGIEAKAEALRKQGQMEAEVALEKGNSEAKVIEMTTLAKAKGTQEQGVAEAKVLGEKMAAEAKGVAEKALAMQKLDGVGKEHEEYRLRLEQEKEIALAEIHVQRDVAEVQSQIIAEALKSAKIDIVGGDNTFINSLMDAINKGKSVDRMVNNSQHLTDFKKALLGNGNGGGLISDIKNMVGKSGLDTNDIKNLTLTALLLKLRSRLGQDEQGLVSDLLNTVGSLGIGEQKVSGLL